MCTATAPSLPRGASFHTASYRAREEYTFPGLDMSSRKMENSMGVRLAGSRPR